jgi:hypothetical protein
MRFRAKNASQSPSSATQTYKVHFKNLISQKYNKKYKIIALIRQMTLFDTYITKRMDVIIAFIIKQCSNYNIDKSHGLIHSIKTAETSRKISVDADISDRSRVIIEFACLLHDMCDKKYMDEAIGIHEIKRFLKYEVKLPPSIIYDIVFIISTMSYSKVKKNGYPHFENNYELEQCYHIVRNSDLLESYDLERCIDYHTRNGAPRYEGIKNMLNIYKSRISRLLEDGWINIPLAKVYAIQLHEKCNQSAAKYIEELRETGHLDEDDLKNGP